MERKKLNKKVDKYCEEMDIILEQNYEEWRIDIINWIIDLEKYTEEVKKKLENDENERNRKK